MISIIVPVYNGEKYIMPCADALIRQTYKDIEIIFIDDGSGDNTPNLLKEVQQTDSRVKVIIKKNGGASSARNAGLNVAAGEYIMFCDIDDLPKKSWCEELLKCTEQFPEKLSLCAALKKDSPSGIHDYLFTMPEEKISGEYTELDKDDLITIDNAGMLYSLWNKIYSTKIIQDNNIRFDETTQNGEDALFVFKYLTGVHGNTVFLNKTLYSYINQNPDCLSIQKPYEEMLTAEKVFKAAEKLFSEIGFTSAKTESEFYIFYLDRFFEIIGKIISDKKDARKERLRKINAAVHLPGIRKCLSMTNPEKTHHKKLLKIYNSSILTFLYHLKIIYFR